MKKTSDWLIALGVIVCSVILLAALSFALTGNPFDKPERTLRVEMPDVTGIQTSSMVKYGGAPAGTIFSVRILTPEERQKSDQSENAIELVLAIRNNAPPFPQGTTATVSADTLLADKFILLTAGPADAPPLESGALISGTPPTTIDSLVRTLDRSLQSLDALLPGPGGGESNILDEAKLALAAVQTVIEEAKSTLDGADELIVGAKGTLTGADGLITGARGTLVNADATLAQAQNLLTGDKRSVETLIADLTTTAERLEGLSARAEKLIDDNADNLDATLADARVATENLKVTATYAKALVLALTRRPQQLLWGAGRKPIQVPTEGEILNSKTPIILD